MPTPNPIFSELSAQGNPDSQAMGAPKKYFASQRGSIRFNSIGPFVPLDIIAVMVQTGPFPGETISNSKVFGKIQPCFLSWGDGGVFLAEVTRI